MLEQASRREGYRFIAYAIDAVFLGSARRAAGTLMVMALMQGLLRKVYQRQAVSACPPQADCT